MIDATKLLKLGRIGRYAKRTSLNPAQTERGAL
jgi:hypothetical protein